MLEEPCHAALLSYDNFAIYVDTSPATASVLLWCCSCILDSTTVNFILDKLPAYLQQHFQPILNGGGLAILHWLHLPERVNFANAQGISKVHDMTPSYLNQIVPIRSVRRSTSASTRPVESPDTITRILLQPSSAAPDHVQPSSSISTPHTFEVLLSTTTVLIHHTDRRMVAMKGDKDSVFRPVGK